MDLNKRIHNTPELNIMSTMLCSRWAVAETQFGWGIAMRCPGLDDESLDQAAVNSYWNRGNDFYQPYSEYFADGVDFKGKTVAVIGHMTGISRRYGDIVKDVFIFDCEPRDGDLPPDEEENIVPGCDIVVISGSSIQNGTLPHLLEMCRDDAYVMLTGPSVPQCPYLLDYGIDRLAGMSVTNPELMMEFIETDKPGTPFVFGTPFLIKK